MQYIYKAKGSSLPDQFYDIGRLNSEYIKKTVNQHNKKHSKKYENRKLLLQLIYKRLQHIAIAWEFTDCLGAWAKGAGISTFEAFELLDDNTGCQTLMARCKDGIVLLHTEEELDDIKARMTNPLVVGFTVGENIKYSLIYNNLLPGAGVFGWGNDHAIAVDSLFLREDGIEKLSDPMLANIVSWIVWRLDTKDLGSGNVIEIIRGLGSCIDGYSLNVIRKTEGKLESYKLTFTRGDIELETLGKLPGSFLRQINVIEPRYIEEARPIAQWRMPYRQFYRGYWNYYKDRMRKFNEDIDSYILYCENSVKEHKKAKNLIINEITGKLAGNYINEAVGALCTVILDVSKMSVAIGVITDSKLESTLYF